jgi:hypothetical protein
VVRRLEAAVRTVPSLVVRRLEAIQATEWPCVPKSEHGSMPATLGYIHN